MANRNLHPCYCPWCKKSNGKGVYLGSRTRLFHCGNCDTQFLGTAWPGACPGCKAPASYSKFLRIVEGYESIPGDLCSECKVKAESMAQTVREGGVLFRCKKCHTQGVIAGDTDFAKDVRLKSGKPTPEEIGVEVEDCPICTPDEAAKEEEGGIPEEDALGTALAEGAALDNLVADIQAADFQKAFDLLDDKAVDGSPE